MKKFAIALAVVCAFCTGSVAMAAEPYATEVASDGCVVYTQQAFKQFAADHNGQNVTDATFIRTLQHYRHMAVRARG